MYLATKHLNPLFVLNLSSGDALGLGNFVGERIIHACPPGGEILIKYAINLLKRLL